MPPKRYETKYCTSSQRELTFINGITKKGEPASWKDETLPAQLMAENGFYFDPTKTHQDRVGCYCCRVKESGWTSKFDTTFFSDGSQRPPVFKHLERSPDCPLATILTSSGNFEHELDFKWQNDPTFKDPPASTAIRLRTFISAGWPYEITSTTPGGFPSANELAESGFYYNPYEPSGDTTTCMYCGTCLESWVEGDVVAIEHRRSEPSCYVFKYEELLKDSQVKKQPKWALRGRNTTASYGSLPRRRSSSGFSHFNSNADLVEISDNQIQAEVGGKQTEEPTQLKAELEVSKSEEELMEINNDDGYEQVAPESHDAHEYQALAQQSNNIETQESLHENPIQHVDNTETHEDLIEKSIHMNLDNELKSTEPHHPAVVVLEEEIIQTDDIEEVVNNEKIEEPVSEIEIPPSSLNELEDMYFIEDSSRPSTFFNRYKSSSRVPSSVNHTREVERQRPEKGSQPVDEPSKMAKLENIKGSSTPLASPLKVLENDIPDIPDIPVNDFADTPYCNNPEDIQYEDPDEGMDFEDVNPLPDNRDKVQHIETSQKLEQTYPTEENNNSDQKDTSQQRETAPLIDDGEDGKNNTVINEEPLAKREKDESLETEEKIPEVESTVEKDAKEDAAVEPIPQQVVSKTHILESETDPFKTKENDDDDLKPYVSKFEIENDYDKKDEIMPDAVLDGDLPESVPEDKIETECKAGTYVDTPVESLVNPSESTTSLKRSSSLSVDTNTEPTENKRIKGDNSVESTKNQSVEVQTVKRNKSVAVSRVDFDGRLIPSDDPLAFGSKIKKYKKQKKVSNPATLQKNSGKDIIRQQQVDKETDQIQVPVAPEENYVSDQNDGFDEEQHKKGSDEHIRNEQKREDPEDDVDSNVRLKQKERTSTAEDLKLKGEKSNKYPNTIKDVGQEVSYSHVVDDTDDDVLLDNFSGSPTRKINIYSDAKTMSPITFRNVSTSPMKKKDEDHTSDVFTDFKGQQQIRGNRLKINNGLLLASSPLKRYRESKPLLSSPTAAHLSNIYESTIPDSTAIAVNDKSNNKLRTSEAYQLFKESEDKEDKEPQGRSKNNESHLEKTPLGNSREFVFSSIPKNQSTPELHRNRISTEAAFSAQNTDSRETLGKQANTVNKKAKKSMSWVEFRKLNITDKVGECMSRIELMSHEEAENYDSNVWLPLGKRQGRKFVEDFTEAIGYAQTVKGSVYRSLNEDLDGTLTDFVAEMPDNELEMTIKEWINRQAEKGTGLLQQKADEMLEDFLRNAAKALRFIQNMPVIEEVSEYYGDSQIIL